jgi:hypothetical protein
MPSKKKTSKAFKALKKDKFSRDSLAPNKAKTTNLAHLLQLQQQQKNKNRKKTDIATLPTAIAFNHKIAELEARKNGMKKKAQQTANIQIAPATFSFVSKELQPDLLFADSLLEGEEIPQNNRTTITTNQKRTTAGERYFQNRFAALMDDEDDDNEGTKNRMFIQPATFSFARSEQALVNATTNVDDSDI